LHLGRLTSGVVRKSFYVCFGPIPKKATASVVGIGGMVGSAVSLVANLTLGKTLKAGEGTGYTSAFVVLVLCTCSCCS